MDDKKIGWTMAITATVALSTVAPVGRAAILVGMHPTTLLVARYTLASILLGLTLRFTTAGRLNIDRRGLLMCSVAGVANGVATVAYFWALSRISASIASMLISLYPLVVLVLLALRGERLSAHKLIRLGLGITGVYLLLGPGGQVDGLGVLLALIAAASYAVYLVIIQWFLSSYPIQSTTYYVVMTMTVLILGLWLVQDAEWYVSGQQGWIAILIIALVGTYLARLATFRAVQGVGSAQLALLAPLETLLVVFWSLLFLGERLTLYQWLGGSLILLSALLARQRQSRTSLPTHDIQAVEDEPPS